MRLSVPTACILLAFSVAGQAESFLCAGQLSTGFTWTGERWAVGRMETQDKVFVVQPSADLDDYTVTQLGFASPSHYCPVLRRPDGSLLLFCGSSANSFRFSSRTLRFQESYGLGYTDGSDGGANTPHMTIGKCVKLELRGTIE
jgi:hypothetical protein